MPIVGFLALTGAAPVAVGLVRWCCSRRSRRRRMLLRCCAAGLAVGYALLGAEMALRTWFAESNGAGVTLASQRWLDRYWQPVSRWGFRDRDVDEALIAGKKVMWVVGDSYAAGWGIENTADRFSDRLAARLGEGWRVINIAKPGWDTRRQIDFTSTFPYRPDVVVHAYCLNDAERAAGQTGIAAPRVDAAPQAAWLAYVVQHSHLANLIYWRWRSMTGGTSGAAYWAFIERCFSDRQAWEMHATDLGTLLGVYRRNTDHIIALAIPNLVDVAASRPMTRQVEDWFRGHDVDCIPLSEHLAGRSPPELVVNRFDPHANELVHGLIADLVYERLEAIDALSAATPP